MAVNFLFVAYPLDYASTKTGPASEKINIVGKAPKTGATSLM